MGEPIAEVGYLAGLCGYIGTAWQKNPLVWGFSEIWDENLGGVSEGTEWLKYTITVPASELWVLQAMSIFNSSGPTAVTSIRIYKASGAIVALAYVASLAQYEPLLISGNWVLGEGDRVRLYVTGIVLGDDLGAGTVGYKMKLDM